MGSVVVPSSNAVTKGGMARPNGEGRLGLGLGLGLGGG